VFKKIGLTGGVLWMHYGSLDALWVGFNAFPELRKVVHIHGVWMRAPS